MASSEARRVKGEVESGARGAAGPCFNPNEDNVNYQENDQQLRNERWLRVWQHMARQAKTSRGKVIQLLDQWAVGSNQMVEKRLARSRTHVRVTRCLR